MIDINKIREQFPVTKNLIYLDHAAVAPTHNNAVKIMNEYLDDLLNYGDRNYGKWFEKLELIREGMAHFIGAESDEIAFIKNTSHGISLVTGGLDFKAGDNVIIPDVEFPANVYPWMNLQRKGVEVKFIKTSSCEIPLDCIEAAIDQNTRVVSISSVEFSTGYRNDLKAISQICKNKSSEFGRKIYLCVDGIQSMGALNLNVKDLNIDFLSADGHKWFLTPEGAGIFYCKKENLDALHPISVGWKSVKDPLQFSRIKFELQDSARKFEEGSFNIVGILALGASLELFNSVGIDNIEKRILNLTKKALNALEQKGYEIISPREDHYRSGIISFKSDTGVEKLYQKLVENAVQLSIRDGRIRISPHFYNTEEEIYRFGALLG